MDVPVLKGTVASTESFQHHTDFKVFLFLSTPDTLVSLLPFKFPRHISPLKLKLFICLECFSLLANLLHIPFQQTLLFSSVSQQSGIAFYDCSPFSLYLFLPSTILCNLCVHYAYCLIFVFLPPEHKPLKGKSL